MNLIQVLILSVVEGITEFLPISSTGHLILTAQLLSIPETDFVKTFQIVIQLGAILAVIVLYIKRFLTSFTLLKKIIVAFIPTAVVGFTLYPLIKYILIGNSEVTLNAIFWGGVALIAAELLLRGKHGKSKNLNEITYLQALLIGIFQSFSVIPGVSRAAATITGGLLVKLDRETATEFSFLLAVPTMFAASGLDIWKSRQMIADGGFITLFVGTVASFVFAMFAVKFLVNFVKKHDFIVFGIYRILLAVAFWFLIK